jgi:hypothetical protein
MMNTTPAIRVILADIAEESDRLTDEDDILFSDDDFEELLPKLAARIAEYNKPFDTLVMVFGILTKFVKDPSLIPPLDKA